MTQQQNPAIPAAPADLQSFGSTILASANQLSVAGTSMAAAVQTARISALKRAATVAVATYGANSTEAIAAGQAVTTAQAQTRQLQILNQKASTPQPTVAATGWALHGRVYDANLNPQERYTVFLVDAQKNYLSDYGFSYTDSTGYFLIQYSGASSSGASSSNQSAVGSSGNPATSQQKDEGFIDLGLLEEPEDAQQSSDASGAPSSTAPIAQAFIDICDANANPALANKTPFTPIAGQATYQVLTIPASGQSLGDPPAEIRAVAMPPSKSKTPKPSKANG